MKKLIFTLCLAICALFSNIASGQTMTKEMLHEFVKEIKKELPQKMDDSMTWTDIYLRNSDSELIFSIKQDPSVLGLTTQEMIKGYDELTPAEKKTYLGEEFNSLTQIIPVPMYAIFHFPDGQKYTLKLSD